MARLSKEHKAFIVRALARYSSLNEIMSGFQETFKRTVSKKQVSIYHPENKCCTAGKELRELFYRERDTYLNDTSDLPLTKRGYRIRELCETAAQAKLIIDLAGKYDTKMQAMRVYTDTIMKIDKLLDSDRRTDDKEPDQEDSRPTFQQINSYIYIDK